MNQYLHKLVVFVLTSVWC